VKVRGGGLIRKVENYYSRLLKREILEFILDLHLEQKIRSGNKIN
jgi:hypothetical protein